MIKSISEKVIDALRTHRVGTPYPTINKKGYSADLARTVYAYDEHNQRFITNGPSGLAGIAIENIDYSGNHYYFGDVEPPEPTFADLITPGTTLYCGEFGAVKFVDPFEGYWKVEGPAFNNGSLPNSEVNRIEWVHQPSYSDTIKPGSTLCCPQQGIVKFVENLGKCWKVETALEGRKKPLSGTLPRTTVNSLKWNEDPPGFADTIEPTSIWYSPDYAAVRFVEDCGTFWKVQTNVCHPATPVDGTMTKADINKSKWAVYLPAEKTEKTGATKPTALAPAKKRAAVPKGPATTAREAKRKDAEIISYPVSRGAKIPKGTMVFINPYGYAVPDDIRNTSGCFEQRMKFAGVAYETVDNSAGDSGTLSVRVETTGSFVFDTANRDCSQILVGSIFQAVDNHTVEFIMAPQSAVQVGVAVAVEGDRLIRIKIDKFTI